jgi:hypothetical protein
MDRFSFSVAGVTFQAWQVIAIILLIFLLVIVMASVRRHFLEFTVRGAGMGVLLGFLLALVIEGLLLVGGRTILITTLGWKNPPKPIAKGVDAIRGEFMKVLGDTDEKVECVEIKQDE